MSEQYRIIRKRSFFRHCLSETNITTRLIILNVLIFLVFMIAEAILNKSNISLYPYFALKPQNLFDNLYLWTLLTSIFMHANLAHLFVNMISLYFLGSFLEMIIGKKRFIWLYVLSGIFAGLFFCFLAYFFGVGIGAKIFGAEDSLAVGASGALFGIAGVLAILTPRKKVYLILGPIIAIVIEAVLVKLFPNQALVSILDFIIFIYILFSIFSMTGFGKSSRIGLPVEISFWLIPLIAIVPLVIIGLFIELPIGNMAHLGGFIAGACYGLYLRKKYKKKTMLIDKYFSR